MSTTPFPNSAPDELPRPGRHHHLHRGTFLDQSPTQFSRLVAGNATRQAQDNMFTSEEEAIALMKKDRVTTKVSVFES